MTAPSDVPMPEGLAATPLGGRLALFISQLRVGDSAVGEADLRSHWLTEPPNLPPRQRYAILQHFARAIGAFRLVGYETPQPDLAVGLVEDTRGRSWRLAVMVEAAPPYRIRIATAFLGLPPGLTLRDARPQDAAALRALEQACPVVAGAVRTWYDHGNDYFAGERLMGHVDPLVVEAEGRVVAIHSTTIHDLRIGGAVQRVSYLHRTRILPEFQGGGLFAALNGAAFERNAPRTTCGHSFVAEGNEASLKLVPFPSWRTLAERVILDASAQAGAPAGRPATPDDASHLAAVINAAHEREELFVPYTAASLAERVGREPALYGWGNLLVGAGALVGVWDARLGVVREDAASRRESVRALVLDHGCLPGAEAELVALLRAWCARLTVSGTTELSLFIASGDPARPHLLPLATRLERYHCCVPLPEPGDTAVRGVYVDHLYF